MKKIFVSADAPSPIGPYSQAVQAGEMLYLSGQIAINPQTNELIEGGIEEETGQVMKNIQAVLKEAGYDFSHVIKTTIYLTNMNYFTAVNSVYGSYFSAEFPARETVAVAGVAKKCEC